MGKGYHHFGTIGLQLFGNLVSFVQRQGIVHILAGIRGNEAAQPHSETYESDLVTPCFDDGRLLDLV